MDAPFGKPWSFDADSLVTFPFCLLKASRVLGQRWNKLFQKQKHHHKSDKHHHKRDYHKTKGNEVITEQEEIENKHNIKHNQSSQLMMSKSNFIPISPQNLYIIDLTLNSPYVAIM